MPKKSSSSRKRKSKSYSFRDRIRKNPLRSKLGRSTRSLRFGDGGYGLDNPGFQFALLADEQKKQFDARLALNAENYRKAIENDEEKWKKHILGMKKAHHSTVDEIRRDAAFNEEAAFQAGFEEMSKKSKTVNDIIDLREKKNVLFGEATEFADTLTQRLYLDVERKLLEGQIEFVTEEARQLGYLGAQVTDVYTKIKLADSERKLKDLHELTAKGAKFRDFYEAGQKMNIDEAQDTTNDVQIQPKHNVNGVPIVIDETITPRVPSSMEVSTPRLPSSMDSIHEERSLNELTLAIPTAIGQTQTEVPFIEPTQVQLTSAPQDQHTLVEDRVPSVQQPSIRQKTPTPTPVDNLFSFHHGHDFFAENLDIDPLKRQTGELQSFHQNTAETFIPIKSSISHPQPSTEAEGALIPQTMTVQPISRSKFVPVSKAFLSRKREKTKKKIALKIRKEDLVEPVVKERDKESKTLTSEGYGVRPPPGALIIRKEEQERKEDAIRQDLQQNPPEYNVEGGKEHFTEHRFLTQDPIVENALTVRTPSPHNELAGGSIIEPSINVPQLKARKRTGVTHVGPLGVAQLSDLFNPNSDTKLSTYTELVAKFQKPKLAVTGDNALTVRDSSNLVVGDNALTVSDSSKLVLVPQKRKFNQEDLAMQPVINPETPAPPVKKRMAAVHMGGLGSYAASVANPVYGTATDLTTYTAPEPDLARIRKQSLAPYDQKEETEAFEEKEDIDVPDSVYRQSRGLDLYDVQPSRQMGYPYIKAIKSKNADQSNKGDKPRYNQAVANLQKDQGDRWDQILERNEILAKIESLGGKGEEAEKLAEEYRTLVSKPTKFPFAIPERKRNKMRTNQEPKRKKNQGVGGIETLLHGEQDLKEATLNDSALNYKTQTFVNELT